MGLPGSSDGKESACNAGDLVGALGWSPGLEPWVRALGQEDLLEKGMATHSSILAGKSMDSGDWRATVYLFYTW